MKKLITSVLTAAMFLSGGISVFAEDTASGLILTEESHLKTDGGFIDMIDGTITVGDLKANFAGEVSVAGKADDAAVAADDVVTAGTDSIKAIIWGDADRNGKINVNDASAMLKSIAKWEISISTDAADVDRNAALNIADVSKMLKKLAKWDDISLGNVRMIFENKAVKAEHEDDSLKLSFTNFMNKVGIHEVEHTGENAYKMKLAKNETESCTAILWSDIAREGMTVEITDFVYEYGNATLETDLEWVMCPSEEAVFTQVFPWDITNQQLSFDYYPEVLLDLADSFEMKSGEHQQFAITVTSGKDSPEGMYKATLTFKDAEGRKVKSANVYAYVWDFALPDTPYSASIYNTASYRTDVVDYYPDYFEFMLEQNLSSYKLPCSILSDEADAIMSDPRVTAFIIDGFSGPYTGDISDEETIAAYAKVKSNPDWFKKGLFYYTDEPYGDGLLEVKTTYEYVTKLLGTTDIRNITPLASNDSFANADAQANNIDAVDYIDPFINVWCPQTHAYHLQAEGGRWTPRRQYNKYGEYADRAKAFKEKGEEIWWYVCNSPEAPYANYFTGYQGVIVRLLSWQQYFNDVDGFLYYSTGEWWGTISKYQFDIGNGDGTLLYPGEFWGRTGPSASWRLYQIRDGYDDFDYLSIAEELCGREAVMKVVNKVSSGMLRYTEDYRVLDDARDEIVDMILEAQEK